MQNPFGKNGEIKKETEETTIPSQEPIVLKDDNSKSKVETKEPVKVVEKEKKNEPTSVRPTKTRKQMILEQHGGLESNVPITSIYWKLKK